MIHRLRSSTGLLLLATAMAALYVRLASLRGWSERADVDQFLLHMLLLFGLYGIGCAWVLWRSEQPGSGGASRSNGVWVVLVAALLFRLLLLPAGSAGGWSDVGRLSADLRGEMTFDSFLLYDNDIWRYLWDGRVTSSGLNVYLYSPVEIEDFDDPRLETLLAPELWEEVHGRVGYAQYRTVYPPLAQSLFALTAWWAPGSVLVWKLLMVLFDFASCGLLAWWLKEHGRRPEWALIYAWNPLVVKELAGSAHIDGVVVFFLLVAFRALGREQWYRAWIALALAVLVKPAPILLAPIFLRRGGLWRAWPLPAVAIVAGVPFVEATWVYLDSLKAFAADWAFNAGPWNLMLWLSSLLGAEGRGWADGVTTLVTLMWVAWVATQVDKKTTPAEIGRALFLVLAGYLVLSPTVMPWYLVWALPWVAIAPSLAWPTLTMASLVSYRIYIDGRESASWLVLEYTLFTIALIWDYQRRRQSKPGYRRGVVTTDEVP